MSPTVLRGPSLPRAPRETCERKLGRYSVTVVWERAGADFNGGGYSRAHRWEFDGGVTVPASASPQVVRVPLSDPAAVDPEEAFVAALSSCHMLWFLYFAARDGFTADSYRDDAIGHMERNDEGRLAITRVVLRPSIRFSGSPVPTEEEVDRLHDEAHRACFIANSVRTRVTVERVPAPS